MSNNLWQHNKGISPSKTFNQEQIKSEKYINYNNKRILSGGESIQNNEFNKFYDKINSNENIDYQIKENENNVDENLKKDKIENNEDIINDNNEKEENKEKKENNENLNYSIDKKDNNKKNKEVIYNNEEMKNINIDMKDNNNFNKIIIETQKENNHINNNHIEDNNQSKKNEINKEEHKNSCNENIINNDNVQENNNLENKNNINNNIEINSEKNKVNINIDIINGMNSNNINSDNKNNENNDDNIININNNDKNENNNDNENQLNGSKQINYNEKENINNIQDKKEFMNKDKKEENLNQKNSNNNNISKNAKEKNNEISEFIKSKNIKVKTYTEDINNFSKDFYDCYYQLIPFQIKEMFRTKNNIVPNLLKGISPYLIILYEDFPGEQNNWLSLRNNIFGICTINYEYKNNKLRILINHISTSIQFNEEKNKLYLNDIRHIFNLIIKYIKKEFYFDEIIIEYDTNKINEEILNIFVNDFNFSIINETDIEDNEDDENTENKIIKEEQENKLVYVNDLMKNDINDMIREASLSYLGKNIFTIFNSMLITNNFNYSPSLLPDTNRSYQNTGNKNKIKFNKSFNLRDKNSKYKFDDNLMNNNTMNYLLELKEEKI